MRRIVAFCSAIAVGACSAPPTSTGGPPPAGAVAWAGGTAITAAEIAAVMRDKGVDARTAVAALAFDARAARLAEEHGLADGYLARSEIRTRLARAVLDDIRAKAAETPPGPADFDRIRKAHWLDLDRPEGVRTAHVVVMADAQSGEKRERAKAIAMRLYDRLRAAHTEAAFKELAGAATKEGDIEIRPEDLPAVTRDGRVLDNSGGGFDMAFTNAVWAIEKVGDVAPPFSSSFGWHVAILLERTPAQRADDATLAEVALPEIRANRGADAMRAILGAARRETQPEVPRNIDDVLRSVDHLVRGPAP